MPLARCGMRGRARLGLGKRAVNSSIAGAVAKKPSIFQQVVGARTASRAVICTKMLQI
jgi:hypothetical protein